MDTSQLDALIVEHLADLDAAASHVHQVEERIWAKMGETIETWAKGSDWKGSFDRDVDGLWLAPPEWASEGEEVAWFELDSGPADQDGRESDLYFDLSRICGLGEGSVALWLRHKAGPKVWKPIAKANAGNVTGTGFSMNDYAKFYMDCTPAQAEMVQALADADFEQALQPLVQALARLPASVPAFTAMLQQAKLL